MLLSEIAREQNVLDLPLGWFPSKQGMVSTCRMVYIDIFLVRGVDMRPMRIRRKILQSSKNG